MFCAGCGSELKEDNYFCEHCGRAVIVDSDLTDLNDNKCNQHKIYKGIKKRKVTFSFIVILFFAIGVYIFLRQAGFIDNSSRYAILNGIWTYGDSFVEIDGNKLKVYKRDDDFTTYKIRIKKKNEFYHIKGWHKDSNILINTDEENLESYNLILHYKDEAMQKNRSIIMVRATYSEILKMTEEMDRTAKEFIVNNGRNPSDYNYEKSFVKDDRLYYIYLDKGDSTKGLIVDRYNTCYAYNHYKLAGMLKAQEYFLRDEDLATRYEMDYSGLESTENDKWTRYYNNKYNYSVNLIHNEDFILRDYGEIDSYYGVTLSDEGFNDYYQHTIGFTVIASEYDEEYFGMKPFARVYESTQAGGSSPLGTLEFPGAEEGYMVMYADSSFFQQTAFLYRDGIEYQISLWVEAYTDDGVDYTIFQEYEPYLYYMIKGFKFEDPADALIGLDKYEKTAAKYVNSIYGDDIRNYELSFSFKEKGKNYYEFMNRRNVKMGVIVDEDLRCYDILAYNFSGKLEEIIDY